MTRLERTLRRVLSIKGRDYVVTLDEAGLRLTLKGHRKGQELRWEDFVSGEAALATALNASLAQANDAPAAAPPPARKKKRARKNPGARSR